MHQSIYSKRISTPVSQHLAKMREQLINIGEMERVLRERSASLEVYRYLLDAHRLGWPRVPDDMLDFPAFGRDESNRLAV
ncbi:hypothetical protein [Bradyrhizobium sp. 192]|uniref:hypothetical protein n=1 Tax=Bradyrhizobium sp. 192 TaxID=2782660 RepID=UPI001FFEB3B8|nr:hypothetical protein [Bradyrhizobium sp. 192]UPJ60681.1 hypothetical protein IVB24_14195 [Bradyrhizobium sp. 192]